MNAKEFKYSKLLFQGDSITDCGRTTDACPQDSLGIGYPNIISKILGALYPLQNIEVVNRGISGNRISDLIARWQTDTLDITPDFLSIFIGINDTWRVYDSNIPSPIEEFEARYCELIESVKNSRPDMDLLLIEPFLMYAPDKPYRDDLNRRIDAVRKVAQKYKTMFLPLDGLAQSWAIKYGSEAVAFDGVHLTELGHSLLATEIMKLLEII